MLRGSQGPIITSTMSVAQDKNMCSEMPEYALARDNGAAYVNKVEYNMRVRGTGWGDTIQKRRMALSLSLSPNEKEGS